MHKRSFDAVPIVAALIAALTLPMQARAQQGTITGRVVERGNLRPEAGAQAVPIGGPGFHIANGG